MLFRPRLAPSSATLIRPFAPFPRQPRFPLPGHVLTAYELSRYGPFYHLSGEALPGRYDTCPLFLNPPGNQGRCFIDYGSFSYRPGDVWNGETGPRRENEEEQSLCVERSAGCVTDRNSSPAGGLWRNDQGRNEDSASAFERVPRTCYEDFFPDSGFPDPPYNSLFHHQWGNYCNDASIPCTQYGSPGHTQGPYRRMFEPYPANYSYGLSGYGYPFGVGPMEPDLPYYGYQNGPPFSNGDGFRADPEPYGVPRYGNGYGNGLNGQLHQNGLHPNDHLHQNGHSHQNANHESNFRPYRDSSNLHLASDPQLFRSKSADGLLQSPQERPDRFVPTLVDLVIHETHFLPKTYTQKTARVALAARPADWVQGIIAQCEDVTGVANHSEKSIANHSEEPSPGPVALAIMVERLVGDSDNEIQHETNVAETKVEEESSPESSELIADSDIVLKRFEPSEW